METYKNQENTFTIIGIDTGSNIGISVMTLNATTLQLINIETRLCVLNSHVTSDQLDDKLLDKLMYINILCKELYATYNPLMIMVEAAFLNIKFPKAVMQLSQYIASIELSFRQCNPYIKIFRYPPRLVKSSVNATGTKKEDLLKALKAINEISSLISFDHMSEHEIDSIAVGYTGILEIRTFPHLLYSYN